MAVLTGGGEPIEYRYFVCDLMSNELLAEIPFRSVSYSRSLTEAGTFNGDIAVTEDTYNLSLYENTLPAKTALYVVRRVGLDDPVCVWGGIIWSRTYSLIDKVLSVSATEFTSYLTHRVVWKTYNSSYEATAEISGNTMTVTLTNGQYGFTVGEAVYIYWSQGYFLYNGYFEVLTVSETTDARSVITVPATYINASTGKPQSIPALSVGVENPLTIETRQDTYQYARDLLRELKTDLFDFDFANDDIRPGIDLFNEISTVSRSANVATVVTTRKHELTSGQKIIVSDVQKDSFFDDKEAVVKDVLGDYSFTYENEGPNVATSPEPPSDANVETFRRLNNVATIETSGDHDFNEGDIVFLENVSQSFDGYFTVYGIPASLTQFQVVMIGSNIAKSYTDLEQQPILNIVTNGATATLTFAENEFATGQRIKITSANPPSYNGVYVVQSSSNTTLTVNTLVTDTYVSSGLVGTAFIATAKRRAAVTYGTFGEHSTLGDLGFDLSQTANFSSNLEANPIIRGYELKTVYDIFEEYSTKPGGFEYRIDCEYDPATNSFKKYFKFLPLVPASLTEFLSAQDDGWAGDIPASAYGATELMFEYPGNILEAQFEENAEESATRFFVQGKDSRLSSDASQPYSAASNHKLLRQGWPILDAVEDLDSPDETVLYKQAARLLEESVPPISTFTISVNGSSSPKLGSYDPGDWCSIKLNDDFVALRASSYLEQDYGTDNGVLVRKIVSYSVGVPDSPGFPEEVAVELITEPSVPISGVTILDGKAFNGD